MKLGISNIAVKTQNFSSALKDLKDLGIEGIEIAPGVFWENPLSSSKEDRHQIKQKIMDSGLKTIGLHALFYRRPDLQIFGSLEARCRCLEHLNGMLELCADLGGEILSFGGVETRKKGNLSREDALAIAAAFFHDLAQMASDFNIVTCIEPLSSAFECDFILTADEGAELISKVNHPHFQLLLDTGNMSLNQESACEMIKKHISIVRHIHINNPKLLPPQEGGIDHGAIASVLREIQYQHWVSLEFRETTGPLSEVISYGLKCYK